MRHPTPNPVLPIADAAGRHHARAAAARGTAWQELALALGVVAAALAAVLVALLAAPVGSTAEMLLRVHGAGLLGLFGLAWGAARLDRAGAMLAEAGRVRRAIEAGQPAWLDPGVMGD